MSGFPDLFDGVLKTATQVLGEPVTYLSGATSAVIQGIVGNSYVEVRVGEGPSQPTLAPTCDIRLSDLSAPPARGDQVIARGITYNIIDSQENGQGGTTLVLQKP